MIPWWGYLLGIFGALLLGLFIAAVLFFIYSKWNSYKLKKSVGLPITLKDSLLNKPIPKKEVSAWLQKDEVKAMTLDGGKERAIDTKEVEENERERFAKYREFEKLRRAAKGKPRPEANEGLPESNVKQPERASVPNELDLRATDIEPSAPERTEDNDRELELD